MPAGSLNLPFLTDLEQRGLLCQKTAELTEPDFAKRPVLYVGFDPSASSLHAGSLLPVLTMDRFRRRGGQVIVLVGGATGLIGDPSGKDKERDFESETVVGERLEKLRAQLRGLFARTEGPEPIFVNNADWYRAMNVLTFLRDVGKNFSVNEMLTRDSVRTRLENRDQGISYTEFSYQLLQSYDFVHLHRAHGCTIQMGASDQWGNIVSGVDLVRRLCQATVHGLTVHLLTNSEGKKYGKSEKGAVWLDPEQTSPYEFFQFWFNTADADAPKFLQWLTDFTPEEIAAFQAEPPAQRAPQKALAGWLTARVHGPEQADLARRASAVIFSGQYAELKPDLVQMLATAVPTYTAPRANPCPVWEALEKIAGRSKGDVRRLVNPKVGASSVAANGVPVTNIDDDLRAHATAAGAVILSVGKRDRFLVRFDGA